MNLDIKNSKYFPCKVLSFKSEKLKVDYITLNIPLERHVNPKRIREFLLRYRFNSKFLKHENVKDKKPFFSIKINTMLSL